MSARTKLRRQPVLLYKRSFNSINQVWHTWLEMIEKRSGYGSLWAFRLTVVHLIDCRLFLSVGDLNKSISLMPHHILVGITHSFVLLLLLNEDISYTLGSNQCRHKHFRKNIWYLFIYIYFVFRKGWSRSPSLSLRPRLHWQAQLVTWLIYDNLPLVHSHKDHRRVKGKSLEMSR